MTLTESKQYQIGNLGRQAGKAIATLLQYQGCFCARKYLLKDLVISVTRKRYKQFNKKVNNKFPINLVVTIGKPNYASRKFIKDCIKASEPFPVKKIQVKS